ncbi:MAG TPA: winged helix-turn-helix domain-containing protein [Bryobacteraceae bacterium]|jgi:GntR family transcriptional regulator/MocR family aminotransferase|nr:winged helix-turn-helix domain-containing protein [Bryobacteraceae bacterium]
MERAILHFEGTTFELNPNSRRPLYLQLRDALRRLILNHNLPPGATLPSTRALAKKLAVSRNTVVNAYEALAADALVTGAIGSGTRVAPTMPRRRRLDLRRVLRESHFPGDPLQMSDPDGNPLLIINGFGPS